MSTVKTVRTPTVLRGIPYDMYVWIRDRPGNDGLRMTYYDGALEIMSPEMRHERGSCYLSMLVNAYAAVFDVDFEPTGSTTFHRGTPGQTKGKGKEPDKSYYFTHAALMRTKETVDLNIDPPPDLWIEIDNRGSSKGRLPVYAALGVPEVWRYQPRRRALWFGRLEDGVYVEIDRSGFLTRLTPALVLDLLDEAGRGAPAWDRWMRVWMDTALRRGIEDVKHPT